MIVRCFTDDLCPFSLESHRDQAVQTHMDSVLCLCVALWGNLPQADYLGKCRDLGSRHFFILFRVFLGIMFVSLSIGLFNVHSPIFSKSQEALTLYGRNFSHVLPQYVFSH